MSSIIITLHPPGPSGPLDLELPGDVMLNKLLPELERALKLPLAGSGGRPITYQLIHQARQRTLRETDTLASAGVVTGDILSLASSGAPVGNASAGPRSASAMLRSESGLVFALDNYGKPELTVGRYDERTGQTPDIDLSDEPSSNTVSRFHALLRKRGAQWLLLSTSPKNTTQVRNTPLVSQQPWPLRPNDTITLGAVKLIFEAGHQS